MFTNYVAYIKDNPKGYWFRAKLYGWGWTPATWQGWAITIGYIVIILSLALTIDKNSSDTEVAFMLLLPMLILTSLLIGICYKTGEKPRWQWGLPKDN